MSLQKYVITLKSLSNIQHFTPGCRHSYVVIVNRTQTNWNLGNLHLSTFSCNHLVHHMPVSLDVQKVTNKMKLLLILSLQNSACTIYNFLNPVLTRANDVIRQLPVRNRIRHTINLS
jgi:hypothetical protein